jgi:hypothetical protein
MRAADAFAALPVGGMPASRATTVPVAGCSSRSGALRCAIRHRPRVPEGLVELQALAWSRRELRERVAHVNSEWRTVLTEAFAEPHERYGIGMPLDALVSLVITFNDGITLERLSVVETGQAELLEWIDGWLERMEAR